jgi:two-component system OmpR family response regulator
MSTNAEKDPRRILVVDDYRPIADLLVKTLRVSGCDARVAYDGAEALRVAEEFRPHALLVDARLPDMDGWALGAEMERKAEGCRVLLMSASPDLFRRPPGAPRYKMVQKSAVLEELAEVLGSCPGSE